jgi:hypothetical protein
MSSPSVNFALVSDAPCINAPKQFGSKEISTKQPFALLLNVTGRDMRGIEAFVARVKEKDRPAVFEWLVPGVRAVLSSVCCQISISTLLL